MNFGRALLVAFTVLVGCSGDGPIVADNAAERLLPLSTAAARCIAESKGRTDAAAATCTCRAVNGEVGGKPLNCHEGPGVLAFKGTGLPVTAERGESHWYALAYAPAERLSERTEDREMVFWGYGTVWGAPGLPAHWYVISICNFCD